MNMHSRLTRRWRWVFPVSGVAIAMLLVTSHVNPLSITSQKNPGKMIADQTLVVSVEQQAGVPVQISVIKTDATNPLSPQLELQVINISSKAICTFAIIYTAASLEKKWGGGNITLTNILSLKEAIQPTQSKAVNIASYGYVEPVTAIMLSVDFVEFVDGTTWGQDIYKSGERVAGQRAGANAVKTYLLGVKEREGASSLINAITKIDLEVKPSSGHTAEWEGGFQTGTAAMRERLKSANNSGGLEQIELELRQPYDASEGRQGS